jgi:hypothetical protein
MVFAKLRDFASLREIKFHAQPQSGQETQS